MLQRRPRPHGGRAPHRKSVMMFARILQMKFFARKEELGRLIWRRKEARLCPGRHRRSDQRAAQIFALLFWRSVEASAVTNLPAFDLELRCGSPAKRLLAL